MMGGVLHEDELPADPDLDDLPEEIFRHPGPFVIAGVDPDTGEHYAAWVSREHIAAGFADRRRALEDADPDP
jgi:hypothetical protein